jgi:hypothetical protein
LVLRRRARHGWKVPGGITVGVFLVLGASGASPVDAQVSHPAPREVRSGALTIASGSVSDPLGDTTSFPSCSPASCSAAADITDASVELTDDGSFVATIKVNRFVSPDTWEYPGSNQIQWTVSADANTQPFATFFLWRFNGTSLEASTVGRSCFGTYQIDEAARTYTLRMPSRCVVGARSTMRWSASLGYRVGGVNYFDATVVAPSMSIPGRAMPLAGGTVVRQSLTAAGVPSTAVAVALNATVTGAPGDGYVTVFPCGDVPSASNLNFRTGQTVPNMVIAPIDLLVRICVYTSASTHVILDVVGWFEPGGTATASSGYGFKSVGPTRLLDTRSQGPKLDTHGRVLQIAGSAGVPVSSAGAASLNVTVTNPSADGYLTVYPCGQLPNASNLNFTAGQTVPNAVLTPLSPGGATCLWSSVATDVIVDINGWFPVDPLGLHTRPPVRLLDTRTGTGAPRARLAANVPLHLAVTGSNGVPNSGVAAVSLNVTVTSPAVDGYVTVYPCGAMPNASSLNFATGQTIPNAVLATVSAAGEICLLSTASTDIIADLSGWIPTGGPYATYTAITPTRVLDSRGPIGEVELSGFQ